ncbi:hypothetical protein Syun_009007 [Stephania yunnanensis]|uniref:Uncharacterized protein n=1 Tax=Stephania yunnanensis TaxID=152371 RepID=A0AAP0PN36_9MAGN
MNPSLNCAMHLHYLHIIWLENLLLKVIHMILEYVQSYFSTIHIHDLLHELQVLQNDWKK